MEIFDTHCHLNDEALYNQIDEVVLRAKNAGITKIIVPGWDKKSSQLAIKIAEKFDGCYAAVGYHPENIENLSEEDLIETLELCQNSKVVAIGEIGLDYHWTRENKEKQKEIFIKQIQFANENGFPVIVHSRDSFEDCVNILKEYNPKFGVDLHCYSGSVEALKTIVKSGWYIGLDGPVTFKNSVTPKAVAAEVPLENLLLETDAPYMSPHPLRGTTNEPANIRLILDEIANQKGISKKHIAEVTFQNALKLFRIK